MIFPWTLGSSLKLWRCFYKYHMIPHNKGYTSEHLFCWYFFHIESVFMEAQFSKMYEIQIWLGHQLD